jgi:hypothetical protein
MRDASSVRPFILPGSEGRKFNFHISRAFRVFGEPNPSTHEFCLAGSHHCHQCADIPFTVETLTVAGQRSTRVL